MLFWNAAGGVQLSRTGAPHPGFVGSSAARFDLFEEFTEKDSKLTDYKYLGVRTDYLNETRTDNVTGESSNIKDFIDMGQRIDLDDIITFWGENTVKADYMNERLIKYL